jgi:hypothetical protein
MEAIVLKLLKFMGLTFGLVLVVIAFSGVKYIGKPCTLTSVDGYPSCDENFQWSNDSR